MRMQVICLLLTAFSNVCWAADSNQWECWIEQKDKVAACDGEIKLAKHPFIVHFKGAPNNAYGLAATASHEELPTSDDLGSVFRFSNGLLVDNPNTKISVSDVGIIAKQWSSWNMWAYHEPNENGYISGFQKQAKNSDGTITLTRKIDQLCIDNGVQDVCRTVTSPMFNKFFILITTIPPLGPNESIKNMRWLNPKRISIEFY